MTGMQIQQLLTIFHQQMSVDTWYQSVNQSWIDQCEKLRYYVE